MIVKILILFAALSIGGTLAVFLPIIRCAKGKLRGFLMAGITALTVGLAIVLSAYNVIWLWGIIAGYAVGVFIVSIIVVGAKADDCCFD